MVPTPGEVRAALRESVADPELGVNIVDLGLVYDVRTAPGQIEVEMTLTSPTCPLAQALPFQVQRALEARFPGQRVHVQLVWEPHWTPDRMAPEARKGLGIP